MGDQRLGYAYADSGEMGSTIPASPATIRSAQVTVACDSLRTQQEEADVKADLRDLLHVLGLFTRTSRDD